MFLFCLLLVYVFSQGQERVSFHAKETHDDEDEESIGGMERKGTQGGRVHFGKEEISTFAPCIERER